uniref:BZIP domain-containing protein n=1 Tax=Macrostomum lignano TaxID=282301 RepID=A0A1I8J0A3_9PLAT
PTSRCRAAASPDWRHIFEEQQQQQHQIWPVSFVKLATSQASATSGGGGISGIRAFLQKQNASASNSPGARMLRRSIEVCSQHTEAEKPVAANRANLLRSIFRHQPVGMPDPSSGTNLPFSEFAAGMNRDFRPTLAEAVGFGHGRFERHLSNIDTGGMEQLHSAEGQRRLSRSTSAQEIPLETPPETQAQLLASLLGNTGCARTASRRRSLGLSAIQPSRVRRWTGRATKKTRLRYRAQRATLERDVLLARGEEKKVP